MGGVNGGAAAPNIHKLFSSEDAAVRISACEGMGQMGKHAQPFVSDMTKLIPDPAPKVREAAEKQLIALGPDAHKAVPDLGRLLQHKDDQTKRSAHKVLNAL